MNIPLMKTSEEHEHINVYGESNSDLDLQTKINQIQTDYYAANKKNTMFKKNQKFECAARVSEEIDLQLLLSKTIYAIPCTNKVCFDYMIFKTFAHPGNYHLIIQYVLDVFTLIVDHYQSFECHFDIQSFTVTAAERYKDVIKLFCQGCLNHNTQFSAQLEQMYVYNTPAVIDQIQKILKNWIDPAIKSKIQIVP